MNYELNNDFALVVVVAEGCGRAAFLLLEDAVEVADVVEAAAVANLGDVRIGVHKKSSRIAQTNVDDVVGDRLAGSCAEEAAEGSRRHSGDVGKSLETYLLLEVLVDVFLHIADAAAFGLILHVGKRLAGQQMIVVLEGEFVENLQE